MEMGVLILKVRKDQHSLSICSGLSQNCRSEAEVEDLHAQGPGF